MISRDAHLACLRASSDELAGLLRTQDLAAPVPDCPGWTLGDLGAHQGGVHRWATYAVTVGKPGEVPDGPRGRDALVAWFEEGADALLGALTRTDPSAPAWGFGPPPHQASFWVRRQAHETRMHLRDAQRATVGATTIDPVIAADGIDEVVTMLFPRQVRLGRMPPLPVGVRLAPTDVDAAWVLAGDGLHPRAAATATVSGTAEELLLALWHRVGLDTLAVEGDGGSARAALSARLTP